MTECFTQTTYLQNALVAQLARASDFYHMTVETSNLRVVSLTFLLNRSGFKQDDDIIMIQSSRSDFVSLYKRDIPE